MATTTSSELALQQVILEMTSRQDMDGVLEAMTRGLVENFDAASALVWLAEDPTAKSFVLANFTVTHSPYPKQIEITWQRWATRPQPATG